MGTLRLGKCFNLYITHQDFANFRTFYKNFHSPNALKIMNPFSAYAFMPDGLFALLVIKM